MSEKRHKQLRREKRKMLFHMVARAHVPEAKARRAVNRKFCRALRHQHCRILAGKEPTRYQVD